MTEQNQQSSLLGKIAAYTEILAKDPKSTIYVSLGETYRKMGMLDDARQVIEKGLVSSPDFSPAHIVLGRILCQLGNYTASETSFQSALKYDPESLAALVGYARLNILIGNEGKARQILLTARELSPADPVINKLLLSLPEPEQKEDTDEPIVQEEESMLSEVASEVKARAGEALAAAPVKEKEFPPLISTTLAELYLKQGLTEQALEVYRQLSVAEPDNLLFRRKIRDIEGDISGASVGSREEMAGEYHPAAAAAEIADSEETLDEVGLADSTVLELDTAGKDGTEAKENGWSSVDRKAVTILNRWLDSIQKRREDV